MIYLSHTSSEKGSQITRYTPELCLAPWRLRWANLCAEGEAWGLQRAPGTAEILAGTPNKKKCFEGFFYIPEAAYFY